MIFAAVRVGGIDLAEFIVVCYSLKEADRLLKEICYAVEPPDNFRFFVRQREVCDICDDRLRLISGNDLYHMQFLQGFRGTVLYGSDVNIVVSKHKISRLADIAILVDERKRQI